MTGSRKRSISKVYEDPLKKKKKELGNEGSFVYCQMMNDIPHRRVAILPAMIHYMLLYDCHIWSDISMIYHVHKVRLIKWDVSVDLFLIVII